MGRPLHKKYFGNRNIGSSATGDDGIGGSRVASVTINTPGSYAGGSSPTVSFSPPDLVGAGAVTATGSVVMEALSAVATAAGNGYNVNDVLTVSYGGQTATFTVATLTGGAGSGVATVTPLDRGSFTATTSGAKATTVAPAGGDNNCTLTITYRVKSVTMTEKGSGYSTVADAAPTFSAGAAAGTSVLEVDSGVQGATGNNENAIVAFAYHTGGSLLRGDIVKQVSTNRYKVENATATAIAKLKSTIATAAGEMNIVAIDTAGNTYYVTKLTAHKATLVPAAVARLGTSAGSIHASGSAVPWSFAAASTGYVQIENA